METKYGLTLWESLVVPILPILIGSFIREWKGDPSWYRTLSKSNYHPQEALIILIWLFIFPSLGFSYFLVQESYISEPYSSLQTLSLLALIFFGLVLVLNLVWFFGFFYLNNLELSFKLNIVLTLITTTSLILSSCVNYIAGVFSLPYFLWVCYTTFLNWSLVKYNNSDNNHNNVYAPLLA